MFALPLKVATPGELLVPFPCVDSEVIELPLIW